MAKTEFTLQEYINNPLGDATMTHREMYKDLYTKKLDEIIEKRKYEQIYYSLYYTDKDTYYVHFKIPSESVDDLSYDTVIYFYPNKNMPSGNSLVNHYIKVFSNDSTFNYVYAYAFNKRGLIIPDLKLKLNEYALKTKAEKTNPKQNIGYIKSIYFAYILMKRFGLFNKLTFKTYGRKYNKNLLLREIASFDEKTEEYNLRKEAQLNRKREKRKSSNLQSQAKKIDRRYKDAGTLKRVSTIKKVHNISKIDYELDKTNKVKRVSKVKKHR